MNFQKHDGKTMADKKRFLEFKLGVESYAVELLMVREVITMPELTPIPKAPAYVCGLMNLRGQVLTVVDLRKRLSITPDKESRENAVIIFDLGDRFVGVIVDSIAKVLNIEESGIKPVPDTDAQNSGYLKAILQQDERLCLWLDPHALLNGTQAYTKAA